MEAYYADPKNQVGALLPEYGMFKGFYDRQEKAFHADYKDLFVRQAELEALDAALAKIHKREVDAESEAYFNTMIQGFQTSADRPLINRRLRWSVPPRRQRLHGHLCNCDQLDVTRPRSSRRDGANRRQDARRPRMARMTPY
jgi:hypothetical protein